MDKLEGIERIKKYSHASRKQKEKLLELITSDIELKKGKFTNTFTKKDMQMKWKLIANELNAIPGTKKKLRTMEKDLEGLKNKCEKKNTKMKTYMRGTGGGPPPENNLDPLDEAVLKILEPTLLEGDKFIAESACLLEFESSDQKKKIEKWKRDNKKEFEVINTDSSDIHFNYLNNNDIIAENKENIEATGNKSVELDNIETVYVGVPSTSTNLNIDKMVTTPDVKAKKIQVMTKKRKLEQCHKNTETLLSLSEKKIKIKDDYYKRKLEIYKDANLQLSRIADSVLQLNSTLSELI